ncbi:MAG: hypothetical protein JXB39_10210 [Deltaproteobacteria bacterium]|nr:hypothetical protein [Deltaproteobacteria bacterium]
MRTSFPRILVAYATLAVCITWPVALHPATLVAGAQRSDLWESLWSLWMFQRQVWAGQISFHTDLIGFPDGGTIVVADLVNAVIALPLVPVLGVVPAYNLLVLGHLVFSGAAAHRLAEALPPRGAPRGAGWVAGTAWIAAPVLVSGIHNGTSEAIAGGWLPLALLAALAAVRRGGAGRGIAAGGALALCTLASWYFGLAAFLAVAALLVVGEGSVPLGRRFLRLLPVMAVGAGLVAPVAFAVLRASTAPDTLVGIKNVRELASVRRTNGPADPVGWFAIGDYRSPDFRELSRYGEDFIHCHYLGWVLLLGGILALAGRTRRRGLAWIALAGLAGGLLAMGPVVARFGSPVLLGQDRAIPLPWFLVERWPGLSSLSLLYRLGALPSLALSVMAGIGLASRTRWSRIATLVAVASVLVDLRLLAPVRGLPHVASAVPPRPIVDLAAAPEGAVMNFPVVGGRPYLWEQTVHGKPLAGSLNFPNSRASQHVWRGILAAPADRPEAVREAVRRTACSQRIRYLVVHEDPLARPDMHDTAVTRLQVAFDPLYTDGSIRVYDLCGAPPGAKEGR